MEKPYILAICGIKNSGKTTLIERLLPLFTHIGLKVAVIKHDGHDFEADVPGTDSYRHFKAGAYGVAVYSSQKMSIVKQSRSVTAKMLMSFFPEADLILCEGQKSSQLPKLEVVRREISSGPVCTGDLVIGYVTDTAGDSIWQSFEKPVFDINEIEQIAQFIIQYCRM